MAPTLSYPCLGVGHCVPATAEPQTHFDHPIVLRLHQDMHYTTVWMTYTILLSQHRPMSEKR